MSEKGKPDLRFAGVELVAEPLFMTRRPTADAVMISLSHPRLGQLNFLLSNARAEAFVDQVRMAIQAPPPAAPDPAQPPPDATLQ